MQASFKQSVRRHFENVVLSPQQVERLQALAEANPDVPSPGRGHSHPRLWKAAVPVLVVACFLLGYWFATPRLHDYTVEAIAAEVALNHIERKPAEVRTGNIVDIRRYFDRLDFVPVESSLPGAEGLRLTGGRYCSLQGHIAAQLHLVEPQSGGRHTLYQTAYRPGAFPELPSLEQGETPLTVYAHGLALRLWVEKGVLHVMTGNRESYQHTAD